MLASCFSETFRVYTARNFPGMTVSSELTKVSPVQGNLSTYTSHQKWAVHSPTRRISPGTDSYGCPRCFFARLRLLPNKESSSSSGKKQTPLEPSLDHPRALAVGPPPMVGLAGHSNVQLTRALESNGDRQQVSTTTILKMSPRSKQKKR